MLGPIVVRARLLAIVAAIPAAASPCGSIRLLLATVMLIIAGCSSSSGSGGAGATPVADYSKVRSMTAFYEGYLNANRNQPPRDEQAFRTYLAAKQEQLQKVGLTVEQMFASPRDGRPFRWVYGRKPPYSPQAGITCYGHEVEPTSGKRIVAGNRGMFQEMDESQFRTLFSNG